MTLLLICRNRFVQRVGSGHKMLDAKITIDNTSLDWKDELRYLGLNFIAGNMLQRRPNFQVIRQKYFRALNGLFGKIGIHSSISVTLSLFN